MRKLRSVIRLGIRFLTLIHNMGTTLVTALRVSRFTAGPNELLLRREMNSTHKRVDAGQAVKTVIFLGAGASAAEGAPVQNDLFRRYFSACRHDPFLDQNHRELVTFFALMFGLDLDVDLQPKHSVNLPTFEEVLGLIDLAELRGESLREFTAQNAAWNSGRLGRVRQALGLALAQVIAEGLQEAKGLHRELVHNLDDAGLLESTAFVSTNYDILIDNALLESGPGADYSIPFHGATLGDAAGYFGWDDDSPRRTPLLKVHGSLNWLHCPVCATMVHTPFEKGVTRLLDDPGSACCSACESLTVPLVVPPTYFKNMSNVFLATIWNRAEQVLRRAEHLVFCGYSFPDADIHIKYLLKRAQTNRMPGAGECFYTVVNCHRGKDARTALDERTRFCRFLGPHRVRYADLSFEEFAADPAAHFHWSPTSPQPRKSPNPCSRRGANARNS